MVVFTESTGSYRSGRVNDALTTFGLSHRAVSVDTHPSALADLVANHPIDYAEVEARVRPYQDAAVQFLSDALALAARAAAPGEPPTAPTRSPTREISRPAACSKGKPRHGQRPPQQQGVSFATIDSWKKRSKCEAGPRTQCTPHTVRLPSLQPLLILRTVGVAQVGGEGIGAEDAG